MQLSLKQALLVLRVTFILMVVSFATVFMLSFTSVRYVDEIWKQLGIEQQQGKTYIKDGFLRGYLYTYAAKNAKALSANDRLQLTQNLLAYTKSYVNSAEFKSAYAQQRQSAKPVQPQKVATRTAEEIQKDEVAKMEKNIAKMEADMKSMNAETVKILQPGLEQNKKMLADYKKPGYEIFKMMADGEKATQENQQLQYEQALAKWTNDYPEDYRPLIKTRLEKMLSLTSNIDYTAALKEQYGKMRFVNPTYESKSREWKMGFRAGKDVTETTRAFVKEWLAELK
jgi:hypothetical protein